MRFDLMSQICDELMRGQTEVRVHSDLPIFRSRCEALSVWAETDTSDVQIACAVCRLVKQNTACQYEQIACCRWLTRLFAHP